jgi:hypothetical protein
MQDRLWEDPPPHLGRCKIVYVYKAHDHYVYMIMYMYSDLHVYPLTCVHEA